MARKNPMPESEKRICQRLREFRLAQNIPLAAFARECGVNYPTYAGHEHLRVPLRYAVFRAIRDNYKINPYWLATGEGPMSGVLTFNDASFATQIKPSSLFSEVYEAFLSSEHQRRIFEADGLLVQTISAISEFREFLVRQPSALADFAERVPKDMLRLGRESVSLSRQIERVIGSGFKTSLTRPVAPKKGKK